MSREREGGREKEGKENAYSEHTLGEVCVASTI